VVAAFLTGLGLAVPAGLNAYIPLLVVAIASRFTGGIELDEPYDLISTNAGIGLLVLLLTVEIVVDKVPGLDHMNDLVHSVIRPPAGAALMMAATSSTDLNPVLALFVGLGCAGAMHAIKAAARPMVTVTTGGIGNPLISMGEDGLAAITAVIAIFAPYFVILPLLLVLGSSLWTLRRLRARGVP
jgi:hypothetical protein